MTSSEYLAAVIERHNLASPYAAAKLLGVNPQTAMNWKKGTSMSDKVGRKVAHLLDLPEAVVLMDVTAEKAKDDGAKALYQAVADTLRDSPALLEEVTEHCILC